MQSVYGFLAAFPDRTVSFLEARDLSSISHTGVAIAGKLQPWQHCSHQQIMSAVSAFVGIIHICGHAGEIRRVISKWDPKHFAALVTDNAANMVKARKLVTEHPGFGHILPIQCFMHGFSLLIGSLLTHPWASDLVNKSQRLVTFIRASHRPLDLLRDLASANGV